MKLTKSIPKFILYLLSYIVVPLSSGQYCGTQNILKALRIEKSKTIPKVARFFNDTDAPVPLIFHFILNEQQLNRIGGLGGIAERVKLQLIALNDCFNDSLYSSRTPDVLRHLSSKPGIRFALAHTDPNGNFTPGFELRVTNKTGFEERSTIGSTFAFSDSKYSYSGGVDIWDPTTYINVWIINTMNNGGVSSVAAVTIPFIFTQNSVIPDNELGVVINYGYFGVKNAPSDFYLDDRTKGLTLVHEFGHYFELWHIWGDDGNLCPNEMNGDDDGIEDTPPQAGPTFGCRNFPFYDRCSDSNGVGVLFMNYMDYSDDTCKFLFTPGQCERMNSLLSIKGSLYTLNKHPSILLPPGDTVVNMMIDIFPNPTNIFLNIYLSQTIKSTLYVNIIDVLGKICKCYTFNLYESHYKISITDLPTGVYLVNIIYDNKNYYKKIFLVK